jgi:predicted esterase
LDALRTTNEAKIAELSPKIAERRNVWLSDSLVTLSARNALLRDKPDRGISAQFLLDPLAHAASIADEMAKLEAGSQPYQRHAGSLWRVLRTGPNAEPRPARIYAPPAIAEQKPLPLVILLGTMGADENTLLDLAVPRLTKLADDKHFLVASVATKAPGLKERDFDALFTALAENYSVDGKRIYFFGHASGGSQLGVLLGTRGDRVAAAALLAAADVHIQQREVPTTIVVGEADEFDTPSKMEKKSRQLRERTSAVSLSSIADVGWFLLPDAALETSIDWLLGNTLP